MVELSRVLRKIKISEENDLDDEDGPDVTVVMLAVVVGFAGLVIVIYIVYQVRLRVRDILTYYYFKSIHFKINVTRKHIV